MSYANLLNGWFVWIYIIICWSSILVYYFPTNREIMQNMIILHKEHFLQWMKSEIREPLWCLWESSLNSSRFSSMQQYFYYFSARRFMASRWQKRENIFCTAHYYRAWFKYYLLMIFSTAHLRNTHHNIQHIYPIYTPFRVLQFINK